MVGTAKGSERVSLVEPRVELNADESYSSGDPADAALADIMVNGPMTI